MSKPGAKPYKWVKAPDGHPNASKRGTIQEHRLVAEQIVNRPLSEKEVVHHKDGNTLNNNIDNLMIFATANDHNAFHGGEDIYEVNSVWRAKKRTKPCKTCGNNFEYTHSSQIFCCRQCAAKDLVKFSEEEIKEIQNELYLSNGNFSKVGRDRNVTYAAIKNCLKRRNLPYHSKDYKKQ